VEDKGAKENTRYKVHGVFDVCIGQARCLRKPGLRRKIGEILGEEHDGSQR